MKKPSLFIGIMLIANLQLTQAQDIFKQYGFAKKPLTLSEGKYKEFFTNDEVVQIGTVKFNTRTNKVIEFLKEDTTKVSYKSEFSSRWLNPDPLAEEYYSCSPYIYALNNPALYIDPNGEFSTKFGAWLYKVFNGGDEILKDKGGEYFVNQKADYSGEGAGASVQRTFDWKGRNTGKDLAFEAKLDAFKTQFEFQQMCEQNGFEYNEYDNRSDAIASMLQIPAMVVLPNPFVKTVNSAINSTIKIGNKSWRFGSYKTAEKWAGQLSKRGWTQQQITEAVNTGSQFKAENLVNKANTATRYVHPTTGKSIVLDDVTRELIHVGGEGFKY